MDRVPLLVSIEGPLAGNKYQISPDEEIIIGRSENCSIYVPDSEISRQHASLTLHNSGIWVQDAGSRNGVFINEKRIVRPTELRPGGRLRLGTHSFVLEISEIEENDPSVIRPIPASPTSTSNNNLYFMIALGAIIVLTGIAVFMWL
jgi:pSer/pThr/pTyr-binding forkhead associated (FHA) protein